MEKKYYFIEDKGTISRQFDRFFHRCQVAEKRAEDYAKSMGATSWVEDVSSFSGGVAGLYFDNPDETSWRRVGQDADGDSYYEPNVHKKLRCRVALGTSIPANTKFCIYRKRLHTWDEVHKLQSMSQWASVAEYHMTHDADTDARNITELLHNKKFIVWVEVRPSAELMTTSSQQRAVKSEVLRLKLPMVPIQAFYEALSIPVPEEISLTPVFFFYSGKIFFGSEADLSDKPDFHPITAEQFLYYQNRALGTIAPGCQ